MVIFLKKCVGILLRSLLIPIVYPLAFLLMIFKYSDIKANNMRINLDRLVEKGGHRKRKK